MISPKISGYQGKLLDIDLSRRNISVQVLDDDCLKKFIGGSGISAKILYDNTGPQTNPLGPDNIMVFMAGPYVGTRIPSSSRHQIVSKSPQTGIFGESSVGGSWGVNLRKAGYDGLVIRGKSDTPVYLWIYNDRVDIRDASHIWGVGSHEAAKIIKGQTHNKATVAVIGQAGENQVRIAGIPHVGSTSRIAGRTGLGAVMGSKNLKGIAVYGEGKVGAAKPDELQMYVKRLLPHIKKATEFFSEHGTSGTVENYEKIGNFPLKNWRLGRWDGALKISGTEMSKTILKGKRACLNCPIACGRHIGFHDKVFGDFSGEGPEYESVGTLGGLLLIDDLKAISVANYLCNSYGLDTISTGGVIAFAIEAYEKGLITQSDTDGMELRWGDGNVLIGLIKKIAKREGIGAILGQGTKNTADHIGKNSVEFAIHVKGLEPSAQDPRRFFSQALNYATAARGACHNGSWSHAYELALSMPEIGIDEPQDPYAIEGKAEFTAKLQNFMCVMDTLLICRFVQVGKAVNVNNLVDFVNLVTDWDMDVKEFMKCGERVFNLKRLYNVRLGISRKDDNLPLRFLTEERKGEGLTNQLPPLGKLLSDYYEYRDWDKEGIPLPRKLTELGLI